MNHYTLSGTELDSVDLKCLVVSRGVKVRPEVYRAFGRTNRLSVNPLMCNCMLLSDGTIVQLTDMGFHLKYLSGILSWENLKLLKYAAELDTPFSVRLADGRAALFHEDALVDYVTFPPKTDFYSRKTSAGLPFLGNAVLQGVDWVAFPCLWPCEYAAAGKPCQFCFSGGDFETLAKKKKPLPEPVSPGDVAEIVKYAVESVGCSSVQLTGGSTFDSERESGILRGYLTAIQETVGRENIRGDILLYITPPEDKGVLDEYFRLGADRIACSLELWDEELAKDVTPGKIEFTTRKRHLDALTHIAEKYGPGRAFSNFIIGIESLETLREGATWLARRGIIPTASIWMPMGRPVNGTMRAPDLEYYKKVKELFAELYSRYKLEPTECCGLNVCMERDMWKYSQCGCGMC